MQKNLIHMQLNDLTGRMERLEYRMDNLEDKLVRTRQELHERIDRQDAKIERLTEQIRELRHDIRSQRSWLPDISIAEIACAVTAFCVVRDNFQMIIRATRIPSRRYVRSCLRECRVPSTGRQGFSCARYIGSGASPRRCRSWSLRRFFQDFCCGR